MATAQQESKKEIKIDQLNPASVYYLHPGENPTMVLVTLHLDGSNYHSSSRAMKHVLVSKNKFKFVIGKIPEPLRNESQYEAWERCNVMVISWITCSLSTEIVHSTTYIDNAT